MTAKTDTPITASNEHNMGSIEEPHYVVDVEVCQKIERELAAVRGQLPEGMRHCKIIFKECAKGHGWLTATNWVQHDCPTCRAERAESALAAAKAEAEKEGK